VAGEERCWVGYVAWCQGDAVGEAVEAVADVASSWFWVWVWKIFLRFGFDVFERDIFEVMFVVAD
jgi:hypothetical protein